MSKELICILVIGAVCLIGLAFCFYRAVDEEINSVVDHIEHMDDDVKF